MYSMLFGANAFIWNRYGTASWYTHTRHMKIGYASCACVALNKLPYYSEVGWMTAHCPRSYFLFMLYYYFLLLFFRSLARSSFMYTHLLCECTFRQSRRRWCVFFFFFLIRFDSLYIKACIARYIFCVLLMYVGTYFGRSCTRAACAHRLGWLFFLFHSL